MNPKAVPQLLHRWGLTYRIRPVLRVLGVDLRPSKSILDSSEGLINAGWVHRSLTEELRTASACVDFDRQSVAALSGLSHWTTPIAANC
jgi:hypothetical protein